MAHLINSTLTDQMAASLKMLQDCIDKCPDDLWASEIIGKRAYWEVAYHIAFYADLYLTPHADQYTGEPDWAWPHAAGLGNKMEPPFDPLPPDKIGPVLDRKHVSQYVTDTVAKLLRIIPTETDQTLAGESGFSWYPINRLAMHMVNIRHIMHHTGQLSAALRRHDIDIEWTGKGP